MTDKYIIKKLSKIELFSIYRAYNRKHIVKNMANLLLVISFPTLMAGFYIPFGILLVVSVLMKGYVNYIEHSYREASKISDLNLYDLVIQNEKLEPFMQSLSFALSGSIDYVAHITPSEMESIMIGNFDDEKLKIALDISKKYL